MKRTRHGRASTTPLTIALFGLLALPLLAGPARAQGYGGPLTTEGLHQHNNPSAAARGFGGVTFGSGRDVGLMFANPTSIRALEGLQVSVAGFRQSRELSQEQNYAPVRYYPNLSLLLEGLTDQIPDPDPDLFGFTPADSVQRPFDDIRPDWSRSSTSNLPLHALVAMPVSVGGVRLVAGLGAVRYANLDHYYQHNNVLDPAVLSQRPQPLPRPTDNNPVTVDWYQSMRSREGSLYGYGMALAGHVERYNLTIGLSGMLLDGESDDLEQLVRRGRLTFLANEFRADSSSGRVTRTGTSQFSGQEFAVSSMLGGRHVSIGFVLRPPTTFTRKYEMAVAGDTAGVPFTAAVAGEDRFRLPWRGSVGLLLRPRERLSIGLEYEFRPYASATLTTATGEESSPWHSASLVRVGTEYELARWLVVRGGIRGEADVFVPEGSAIERDPVTYRVFSAGLGFAFSGLRWNLTYEYADMRYADVWGSALSRNEDMRHVFVTNLSFTIPTLR